MFAISHFVGNCAQQLVLFALRNISSGHLKLISKDKEPHQIDEFGDGKESPVTLIVHDSNAWKRICACFDLGFAEAYMFQEVDCDNLSGLLDIYIKNKSQLGTGNLLMQILPRITLFLQPSNDPHNAQRYISSHYDDSDDLFANFLSPDMNYSCAHWNGDPAESLEAAQKRKVQRLLQKARISADQHILEIGCGWGDVAITAAQTTGCRVTALTLSENQKRVAEKRVKEARLEERVQILLQDYRSATGPETSGGYYDRVISIGMFEHVGVEYLDEYFRVICSLLHPRHGVMVIDGITMTNKMRRAKSSVPTFIDRYIFPGGYLPTIHALLNAINNGSNGELEVTSAMNIGPHYGKTLLAWRDNFLRNWGNIEAAFRAEQPDASDKNVEAFRRKWLYYFIYCEAGFRLRLLGNYVIVAAKTPELSIENSETLGEMLE
ncbi:Mycolic acid cyclopropane synthetase-domain-containing protein [Aspergillus bertholletiae]|uniref:Mycolic acid cyclopropane synthetase-domain-containing protein n=1 Tax=Aspergillus bertholletiae TaxID=1226010 RepID=A0A5N7BEK8_9EURO|nr:Mycolic acid cyclopropane synthetase-domain-containing protein [Aspergillus bertholletiae]